MSRGLIRCRGLRSTRLAWCTSIAREDTDDSEERCDHAVTRRRTYG